MQRSSWVPMRMLALALEWRSEVWLLLQTKVEQFPSILEKKEQSTCPCLTAAWFLHFSNLHFRLWPAHRCVLTLPPADLGRALCAWHAVPYWHGSWKSSVTEGMHSLGVNYCQISWSITQQCWKWPQGSTLLQMISQPLPHRGPYRKMFVGSKVENCFSKKSQREG